MQQLVLAMRLLKGGFSIQLINIFLLFLYGPFFHYPDTRNITLEVEEGDGLNITCRITMGTNSTLMWMKNNFPVRIGRSKFLVIGSVNRSQAGDYICVSLSSTGNSTSPLTAVNVLCE